MLVGFPNSVERTTVDQDVDNQGKGQRAGGPFPLRLVPSDEVVHDGTYVELAAYLGHKPTRAHMTGQHIVANHLQNPSAIGLEQNSRLFSVFLSPAQKTSRFLSQGAEGGLRTLFAIHPSSHRPITVDPA